MDFALFICLENFHYTVISILATYEFVNIVNHEKIYCLDYILYVLFPYKINFYMK